MATAQAASTSVSVDDDRAPARDLTVLIPAYNEEEGIGPTLLSLKNEPRLAGATLVVIDDGCTDKTAERALAIGGVTVLRHKNNQGYGAGIKTGTRHATTRYVAWFDADGQHRACDLADMYEATLREHYDAVLGARTSASNVVKSRVAGKAVLRLIADFVANQKIPDINCGLRVFRRDLLTGYLPILPDGFSASTTSTLLFIKRNRHFVFHPVVTEQRAGKSTVKQVRDGVKTIQLMIRILFLFSAFNTFSIVASVFVGLGLLYSVVIAILDGHGIPVLGALLSLVGVMVFCFGIVSDQISALRIDLMERGSGQGDGDWSARTRDP